jgi:hypothetical protein
MKKTVKRKRKNERKKKEKNGSAGEVGRLRAKPPLPIFFPFRSPTRGDRSSARARMSAPVFFPCPGRTPPPPLLCQGRRGSNPRRPKLRRPCPSHYKYRRHPRVFFPKSSPQIAPQIDGDSSLKSPKRPPPPAAAPGHPRPRNTTPPPPNSSPSRAAPRSHLRRHQIPP